MIIRELKIEDAEKYLQLNKETDAETPFLYFEENERKTTLEKQVKNIQSGIEQGYISLVCEIENQLVGYAVGFTFQVNRRKHCMSIAIAMLQGYASKGIGAQLLTELIAKGISDNPLVAIAPTTIPTAVVAFPSVVASSSFPPALISCIAVLYTLFAVITP